MNGLFVVDKPAGMTSHDAVNVVRRATGERSVGHLGTLDPMATGVLPMLLGNFTRLAQFLNVSDKQYTGSIRFGWSTATYDFEGEATSEAKPLTASLEELSGLAQRFQGEIEQLPPAFSAKKINGIPAYKLARAGKVAPLRPVRIHVHEFALSSLVDEVAEFRMHVSSGGYVRSVAHELGLLAGCGAHLASLRRSAAGVFTLGEATPLEQVRDAAPELNASRLVHPRRLLPEMPSVTLDEATAGRVRNGMQVNVPDFSRSPMVKLFTGPQVLLAIARRVAGTLVQPVVVLA